MQNAVLNCESTLILVTVIVAIRANFSRAVDFDSLKIHENKIHEKKQYKVADNSKIKSTK